MKFIYNTWHNPSYFGSIAFRKLSARFFKITCFLSNFYFQCNFNENASHIYAKKKKRIAAISAANIIWYKLELANEKIKNIEKYIEQNYYRLQSNEILNDEEKEFVDNIIQNYYIQANGRRYSESVYKTALNIHAISPKALRYLRSYIPLPSTIIIVFHTK